ncbi:ATP-binding protein [Chamaesiphon sp. OTE_8_metabat_110]|uniref:ATP-binding protein n=1 Tax=Chamaesiphon sp. OTE_8_metabat_110 TaxID=2964696 RepID=UPI00286D2687|nr:ATP-binding protein [Chamaesiphon sp. OTE_8_metabat_110]
MNTRTQNIISLSTNSAVIVGSLAISSYAYFITPQLAEFQRIEGRLTIAIALAVGVKFFRAYPYYLSTLSTLAPSTWRWLLLGLALDGFDLAVLGYMFKLKLSIDSALSAIVCLCGYSGAWAIVTMLADLGLKPVKRKRFYSQWFAGKSVKPRATLGDVSVIDRGELPNDYQEVDVNPVDRTTIDPGIIRNLLGDSMKSTFFCGIQGSGKGFLVSLLAAEARRQGHKTFLLDPKGDDDEKSLWEGAVNRVSRFIGRKEESPETYVEKVKGAIKAYCDYAEFNGKAKYTILIFDEFSSAAGKFASTKNDKLWLVNEIEDLVKLGDAAGICLWLVAQTPHCKNGIDGSLLSSLRRIIIASEDNLAQLQNWTNTAFMTGISLDDCSQMCQASPVNRAVYNSTTRIWYAMPRLRQGETYFDRDSRSMVGAELN